MTIHHDDTGLLTELLEDGHTSEPGPQASASDETTHCCPAAEQVAAVRETADELTALADRHAAADPYGLTADEALLRHAVAKIRTAIGDVVELPDETALRVRGW